MVYAKGLFVNDLFIFRYFPYQRQRDDEQDLYYPFRGGYSKGYRDDLYDNGHLSKYRNGFDIGYHRI